MLRYQLASDIRAELQLTEAEHRIGALSGHGSGKQPLPPYHGIAGNWRTIWPREFLG